MRGILFSCLLPCLSALPAAAQEEAEPDCAGRDKKYCHLLEELPKLPYLDSFLRGEEESARTFAAAAFESAGFRAQEWKEFDTLLAGGRLDAGGALIRAELKKLPQEQWYYVIRLDGHRRVLVDIGGGIMGNATQSIGNAFRAKKDQIQIKCFEQTEKLLRNMEPVKASGKPQGVFRSWTGKPITANRLKLNEHTAPCFRYPASGGMVEIVADSWDNALVPARVWWQNRDGAMYSALSSGDGYCGEKFEDLDGEKCKAMNDRVEKFTENSKKAYEKTKKMINGVWSGPEERVSLGGAPGKAASVKPSQGARGSKASTIKHQPPPAMGSGD